jgi:hypothetical protein
MTRFDTVIKGGTVVDGTRMPRRRADIGIHNGQIAKIGRLEHTGRGERDRRQRLHRRSRICGPPWWAPVRRPVTVQVMVAEPNRPGLRVVTTGARVEERRLPRTVRTDQTRDLTTLREQRRIVHRDDTPDSITTLWSHQVPWCHVSR